MLENLAGDSGGLPATYDENQPHRLIFGFHWNGGTAEDVDGGRSSGFTWSYFGLREQSGDSAIYVAPQGEGNGFALGFSYGGGMSYAIACARAKVFRAVAVYSGAQLSGCEGGPPSTAAATRQRPWTAPAPAAGRVTRRGPRLRPGSSSASSD